MKRRAFIKVGAATLGGTAGASVPARPEAAGGAADALRRTIDIINADVASLQAAMTAGKLTAHGLAMRYLARMNALDQAGPRGVA